MEKWGKENIIQLPNPNVRKPDSNLVKELDSILWRDPTVLGRSRPIVCDRLLFLLAKAFAPPLVVG